MSYYVLRETSPDHYEGELYDVASGNEAADMAAGAHPSVDVFVVVGDDLVMEMRVAARHSYVEWEIT